jgi:hypothetical protein
MDPSLADRIAVTDTIYRYASTIDSFDLKGLRGLLHDNVVAQYGNRDPIIGGDEVATWISNAIATVVWQHHLFSVYHVDIDGDTATALVYHTSHQVTADAPDEVKVLVGRYHNEMRRDADGWKISRLLMEIGWGETRKDDTGQLQRVGGRGPAFGPRSIEST